MAASFLEEPHCRFEKTAIISKSEHSPYASKATEIIEADDDKESNECKHFTIRGYVAEVRKRETKNCWPFLLHNCLSLESANGFPPLPVAKFRWWGCQNCVCGIIATTAQMATGGAMSIQNQDVKSNNNSLLGIATETSQLDAKKVLSKLPQISKENNIKEILKINDYSINISRVGKEENQCLQRDLIKEGFQKSKDGQDNPDEIQNAVGEANRVSNGHTAVNKGKRGEYRNSVGRKKLGVAYLKDVLDTTLVKHKGTKLHKIGHSKMLGGDATSIRIKFALHSSKEDQRPGRRKEEKKKRNDVRQGPTKVDMVVGKDDALDADPAHTLCLGACCQDKQTCGTSVDDSEYMGLTDDKHQLENEVENMHSKKIRKVRLLEDIIRNEKLHTTGNRHTLDGDGKIIHHDFIRSRVTSKEKVLPLNHTSHDTYQNNSSKSVTAKSKIQNSLDEDGDEGDAVTCIDQRNHCVHQRNQLKSVKRRDIHEKLSDEDEGPLLMHRLKNMPKRPNAYESEANTNYINSNIFLSNFSADLSGRKDPDVDVRDSSVIVHKKKSAFNKKQMLSPEDGQVTSSILIGDKIKFKNFSSQDISTKETVIIEKAQHCRMENSDRAGGNAILHSIRNKRLLNDRAKLYQTMDSSSTQKKASLEVWEKSKKPRNMRTTDQEALDDIPMDIVELLARNQHDRYHLIDETDSTNKHKLPTMTENIKYSCGLDPSQINKNNVSDAEQGNLSCQKFQVNNKGFDVWTTFPCSVEMEHEPKVCGCSINGKKKLQIDLNQQYCDSLISEAGSCNLDTNGNCHQLNLSCCRSNNMHSSQSFLVNQTASCENLLRNPHDDVLQHINGASLGVRSHFFNNSNASVLGRDRKIFTHSGDYEKPRNLVGKHHHWGFSPTAPKASSFMDSVNGCHSKFFPADLYSNETISALNLLRLMDQAAWSGEPLHHFRSYSGFVKETDMCVNGQYNESQLEYESREEPCECPLEVVNPSTCQQPRNSCLLFRPLPRIGILGPSLQNEIFNFSKYSRIPTRSSNGFLKTDVKEKIEPSRLNPNTLVWNSHNSLFRCKCSEKIRLDRDHDSCPDRCSTSNTRFSEVRGGTTQVELNNKLDARLPLRSFCEMEICVVNRNPADFTVLDENNEYMIEIKELKLKSVPPFETLRDPVHGKKKQKVMKLNDLKAFSMG